MDKNTSQIKTMKRNIIDLSEDYLRIIPELEETKDYRENLLISLEQIKKRYEYASPEEEKTFWDNINYVLGKYNTEFIKQNCEWAKAILCICRYEYENENVVPYLSIIKHKFSKKK